MLVKTKTTIETEIEIDFPVYVEYAGNNLYKIISETEYIMVEVGKHLTDLSSYIIEVRKGYKDNAVMIATTGRVIPQSKFDEAVVLALQHIHAIAFENVAEPGEYEYPAIGCYKNNKIL